MAPEYFEAFTGRAEGSSSSDGFFQSISEFCIMLRKAS